MILKHFAILPALAIALLSTAGPSSAVSERVNSAYVWSEPPGTDAKGRTEIMAAIKSGAQSPDWEVGSAFACVGDRCAPSNIGCTWLIFPERRSNWGNTQTEALAIPSQYRFYSQSVLLIGDLSRAAPAFPRDGSGPADDDPSHVAVVAGVAVVVHTWHLPSSRGLYTAKLVVWLSHYQLHRVTCAAADDTGVEAAALDFASKLVRSKGT